MTKEQAHKKIKQKFGTISRFCSLSGVDDYELQKFFGRTSVDKEFLSMLKEKIKTTKMTAAPGEISDADREDLRKDLDTYGGVVKFCRENPEFSKTSVFQILNGRRKRLTEPVRELIHRVKKINSKALEK